MTGFCGSDLGLLLRKSLGKNGVVFLFLFLLSLEVTAFEGSEMTTALETEGSDETLDFWTMGGVSTCYKEKRKGRNVRLGIWLSTFFLRRCDLASNNVLAHIILLAQVEEGANLGCPLRAKSLRKDVIRQARDIVITLLYDDDGENGDIGTNDTSSNRFSFTFTSTTDSVARMAIGKKKSNTVGEENTLLHRETLLVVATSDSEDVTLPFVS